MKAQRISLLIIPVLIIFFLGCENQPKDEIASSNAKTRASSENIIYADPQDLSSNISLEEVLSISEFFSNPKNMVQLQFASDKTKYGWLHISKYYHTAQVERSGAVSALPYDIDLSIGEIAYKNKDGDMVSVNQHFDTKPIDAMVVVKNGTIVYERYKTMGPDEKHLWFSCSKVTGSTMLALLEHEGKIDVKKYVSEYLPLFSALVSRLNGNHTSTSMILSVADENGGGSMECSSLAGSRFRTEEGQAVAVVNTFLDPDWGLGARETVSNSLKRYANMEARLAENKGKVNDQVVRDIFDLTLFNADGSFRENGGATKPTKQDADVTNYQMVCDISNRYVWLKTPSPDYFRDWTFIDLNKLWND